MFSLVIKLQKHTCKVAGKEAVYTASRGGLHSEQGRQAGATRFRVGANLVASELSLSLSLKLAHPLSLSLSLSLKVRDWNSKVQGSHKSFH